MLVLHPSSRCDVCLDAYTWETPQQTPHAIPCGHIFCKTCLMAVTPPNCPLCRKAFVPDRLKKLHVDRPSGLEHDLQEVELLQRLALVWDSPGDQLDDMIDEVTGWLEDRQADTSIPLRKAFDAMIKYQGLKTEKRDNLETISTLKTDVEEYKRQMRFAQTTAQAIEDGLLHKAQALEDKVAEYEAAVERLQAEIRMYNQPHMRNPLPPPPEPVPLDRFPPFLQAAAAGPGPYYHNGPHSAPAQAYPSNEVEADDEREPRRSRESKKDRKGKSKAKEGPFYDIYRAISPSIQQQKNGIVPGATPNHRYIPPGEPTAPPLLTPQPRRPGELDNADPYSLMSNWVSEYAVGYGEGYQVAMNNGNGPTSNGNHAPYSGPPTNLDSMTIHNLGLDRSDQHQEASGAWPQQERSREHRRHRERERERETLSQQLSSLSSSAGRTRTSSDDTNPSSRSRQRRHRTSDDHHVNHVNHPVLSNLLSDNTTASRTHRGGRRVDQIIAEEPIPAPPQPHVPDTPASNRTHRTRNSVSSWGTVVTIDNGTSPSGESLAHLQLRGFGRAAFPITVGSDSLSSPSFPFQETESEQEGPSTLLGVRITPPPPATGAKPTYQHASTSNARDGQQSRHVSYPSTPAMQVLAAPPGSRHTQTITVETYGRNEVDPPPRPATNTTHRDANRSSARHTSSRHRRRRGSSSAAVATGALAQEPHTAPADVWTDAEYYTDAPSSAFAGNALGLALNEPVSAGPPAITAPTPVVSSRGFLRSFSYDNFM